MVDSPQKLEYAIPRRERHRVRWWMIALLLIFVAAIAYLAYLVFFAWPSMVG